MNDNSAARTTGRKPRGRPVADNAADVRGAILDSAEKHFAQLGFAAVSVREIAQAVDVTPAMVHYYFGNKLELLKQVLERATEPLANALSEMRDSGTAPATRIASLLINTLSTRPNLPPLMLREVMLPGGVMQDHFLQSLAPRLGGAIPSLLQREQGRGHMDPDIDPRIAALMLLSLCIFPFVVKGPAQPALGVSYDAAGLTKLEDHIVHLIEGGFSI